MLSRRLVMWTCTGLIAAGLPFPVAAKTPTPDGIPTQALTCIATHFEAFRSVTSVQSIIVVDFAACPNLLDAATMLEMNLAVMDADVINSLGTVTLADDRPERPQILALPVAQALCLRDLVTSGAFAAQTTVVMSDVSCWVESQN